MAATRKPSARSKAAGRAPDTYLDLVRTFPLRPIRTDAENAEAIELVATLAARAERKALDAAERDYLDVLVGLVERFESEQYPMPPVTGSAAVRHLIEARGLTQTETAKGAGIAESAFSEMLAGKRKMAAKHVRGLAKFFGVPADLILGD